MWPSCSFTVSRNCGLRGTVAGSCVGDRVADCVCGCNVLQQAVLVATGVEMSGVYTTAVSATETTTVETCPMKSSVVSESIDPDRKAWRLTTLSRDLL